MNKIEMVCKNCGHEKHGNYEDGCTFIDATETPCGCFKCELVPFVGYCQECGKVLPCEKHSVSQPASEGLNEFERLKAQKDAIVAKEESVIRADERAKCQQHYEARIEELENELLGRDFYERNMENKAKSEAFKEVGEWLDSLEVCASFTGNICRRLTSAQIEPLKSGHLPDKE